MREGLVRWLDVHRRVIAKWLRDLAWRVDPRSRGRGVVDLKFIMRHRQREPNWWRRTQLKDPCVYCGGPSQEIDHIHPRSKGGPDHWSNRAPICTRCNRRKAARTMMRFLIEDEPNTWKPHLTTAKSATTTREQRRKIISDLGLKPATPAELTNGKPVQPPYWVNDMRHRKPTDVDLRAMAKQRRMS